MCLTCIGRKHRRVEDQTVSRNGTEASHRFRTSYIVEPCGRSVLFFVRNWNGRSIQVFCDPGESARPAEAARGGNGLGPLRRAVYALTFSLGSAARAARLRRRRPGAGRVSHPVAKTADVRV